MSLFPEPGGIMSLRTAWTTHGGVIQYYICAEKNIMILYNLNKSENFVLNYSVDETGGL